MLSVPELLWPEKPEAAKLGEEELNHPSGSFWLFRWVLWSSSAQVACASQQVPSVSVPGGGQGWGKTISTQRKGIREAGWHRHGAQPHSHGAAPMGARAVTVTSWPDIPSPVKDWRRRPGCHGHGGAYSLIFTSPHFAPLHVPAFSSIPAVFSSQGLSSTGCEQKPQPLPARLAKPSVGQHRLLALTRATAPGFPASTRTLGLKGIFFLEEKTREKWERTVQVLLCYS